MLEICEIGFGYSERVDEGVLKKRVLWDVLTTVMFINIGDGGCLEDRFAERVELVFRALGPQDAPCELGGMNLTLFRAVEEAEFFGRSDLDSKGSFGSLEA